MPHILHRPEPVISPALSGAEGTGGTALFAVPEWRYGSPSHVFCAMKSLFDFRFQDKSDHERGQMRIANPPAYGPNSAR